MEAAGYGSRSAGGSSAPAQAPTSQDLGSQFNFVIKKPASFCPSALPSLACWFLSFVVVHSLSCVWLFVTPWTAAHQAPLSSTISLNLLKFMPSVLRNLYSGQEATVRTRLGTTDWFKIGKGVRQGCILSPCLFKLHTEYIVQNTSGWMNHKLESRLPGEMSTASDIQMLPF